MSFYETQRAPKRAYMTTATTSHIGDIEVGGTCTSHPEKPSRAEFINKVLNYVCGQLAITTIITMYMYFNREQVIEQAMNNKGIVWFPIILSFITLTLMFCDKENRKCWFWSFTLATSFMVGFSTLAYAPQIVAKAVITCMIITAAANSYSIYCVKTGKNLDFLESILGGLLLSLIVVGILNMFIKSEGLHLIITFAGIIIFTGFLVFDLNRLYDKGDEDQMEDPMLAAVGIYLDIVNLFLYLLEAYRQCDGKD